MSDKRAPWMKFYPADWRADPQLRACTPAARGIWLDLIGLMHEAEPYGHLLLNGAQPSIKTLSGLLNVHHKTLIAAMINLSEHGVYSRADDGTIYSRRMVRDHAKALQDKENGRLGGNPRVNPQRPEGVNPPVKGGDKAQRLEARDQIKDISSLRSEISPAPPPKAAPKRAAGKTKIQIDEPMPDAARAFAAERGFVNGTLDEMWTHFTAYHAGKGTLTGSVEASWRTWVLNQVKFQGERNEQRTGFAGNRGEGARAGARSQPRSAATIIMERALADELDDRGEPRLFVLPGD